MEIELLSYGMVSVTGWILYYLYLEHKYGRRHMGEFNKVKNAFFDAVGGDE